MAFDVEERVSAQSAALVSPHFTLRTVLPVLLAGYAEAEGYREAALGDLGSAYSLGALLGACGAVWLAGRHLRGLVLAGAATGLGAFAALLLAHAWPRVLGAFLISGLGFGLVYAAMLAWLAGHPAPGRVLAWQWGIGTLPGMVMLSVIPMLGRGVSALHQAIVVLWWINAVALLLALWLPARIEVPVDHSSTASPATARSGLRGAAAALLVLYAGTTGGWSLLARVAIGDGVAPRTAGLALSCAAAGSCAVALWTGRLRARNDDRRALGLGVLVMVAGVACVALAPGTIGYLVGATVYIATSAFVLTFAGARVAREAGGARGAAASAVGLGLGAILGPAMAGRVYEAFGARAMLSTCAAALVLGWGLYAVRSPAQRRAMR